VAQAGLGVLLAEAVRYLLHRLSHRPGLLWRVHRTHHQPERMYALNGPRLHPGNYVWIAIANSVPMLSLGAPGKAVVLAAVVTSFFVLFQHANVQLPFGGWNWLLATPDVHRLHHERRRGRQGVNYGIVLLLFDRLFGTYARHEAEVAVDAIGLDQDALDPTVARPAFGRANALLRTSR
jgi:sterol desaturase/sphingolipid hydroxylase (fatty acid hydroxylase superfamily)